MHTEGFALFITSLYFGLLMLFYDLHVIMVLMPVEFVGSVPFPGSTCQVVLIRIIDNNESQISHLAFDHHCHSHK